MDACALHKPETILIDVGFGGQPNEGIATVERQQDRLHSVPIIYLSAEDDVSKQLHAMSQGGDDFLTKPIDPRHLIATIHNRGRRARSLLALMIRDSLTGPCTRPRNTAVTARSLQTTEISALYLLETPGS